MVKEKIKSPKMYLYLDSDGIDSLYSQTVDRLETEFIQSQERDKSGKLKTNIGIGKLLGATLGLVEAGAETELSTSGKKTNETKMRFTVEQKLLALNKYLKDLNGTEFFENLPQAAIQAEKQGEGVFIQVAQKFNMPQFSHGNGVNNVNNDQSIAFVIGQTDTNHEYSDTYFRKTQYTFLMVASLSKATWSDGGSMRQMGHDAMFFNAFNGKDVPVNVFGYLIPLSKYTYQIKPYAIWK